MLMPPHVLAWWVHSLRAASGWSQETLAELSRLTVRTVQRVEAGKPSSLDTRRSLAAGLGYNDLDVFNNPKTAFEIIKLYEELQGIIRKAHAENEKSQHPDCVFIDAKEAKTGLSLLRFAEIVMATSSSYDEEDDSEAISIFCTICDYVRDYHDAHDLYSEAQKFIEAGHIDELLSNLNDKGFGIYYCTRNMRVTNKAWAIKDPLDWTIGYMKMIKNGLSNVRLAIPKKVKIG